MRILLSGYYDVAKYLIQKPNVKVTASTINGSLYIPESTINLRYQRGMFDGTSPTFGVGIAVTIYADDESVLFDGYMRSAQASSGTTTLTVVSALSRMLHASMDYTAGPMHPCYILSGLLNKYNIRNEGINAWATAHPAMLAIYVSTLNDSAKGYDAVSQLADMMTMDLIVEAGVVKAISRNTDSNSAYTLKAAGYPQLVDDGTSRQVKGINLRYVFDAGVALSIGQQDEQVWSADYSAGSNLQCYGQTSALALIEARFERFANPKPLYQIEVRKENFVPAFGQSILCDEGPMAGYFRMVGYETDGKRYHLQMEAV